ncbi:MAG TPA: Eco29kI family restriction endonuclease [Pyrinomonadaceae bacterium]|jgi:hypothetical protein|nr:Eco29kI family restriction endonuclease [Pyrinomonadaceae bacterium]
MATIIPFNPLDKKNLGASVAEALLNAVVHPLSSIPKFTGAGIYAIYYTGDFPAYAEISKHNRDARFELPIYVGKAVPKGARTGADLEADPGHVLSARIAQHAESIRAAKNLEIEDFYCRYLVVEDIWIPLGESLIISRYVPLWNTLVEGFGNHAPGKGRTGTKCPRWDVLHPGRRWAASLPDRGETMEEIAREANNHLTNLQINTSSHFIEPDDK